MATLRALFFDMNGVLVDVARSYRRAIEETVEHFTGRELLPDAVQRYRSAGGFADDWRLTHAIITDIGMTVPFGRVAEEFQRRYRGESWNGFICEEPPLVRTDTLERLAAGGRILGVVTGRPDAEARWTLERFGWQRLFPLVVPREKRDDRLPPDPYALQHALLILEAVGRRIDPAEAAYVGCSAEDMAAARAAGLWAVGLAPPGAPDAPAQEALLRERGAHLVVASLDELPERLERLKAPPAAVLEDEARA